MEREYVYVIGLGNEEDWQARRGSLYYIEDRNGEKAMPIFTTPEKIERYVRANFDAPKEAHMDMLESIPALHTKPLAEGRYILMPLNAEDVARAAVMVGADYLIRDPRPGEKHEILRLS
jgi:hypothetical protein